MNRRKLNAWQALAEAYRLPALLGKSQAAKGQEGSRFPDRPPHIGNKLVFEITSADLLRVLTPIWHDKPETARRVWQRISAVMKWAVAMQHRPDNPAGDALGQALGRQQAAVRHMPALPRGNVAAAIKAVRTSRAWIGTKLAFHFLVLTAARSGEVRSATWNEIDLDAAVWTISASRMKANRDHRVPLCRRAIDILREARTLGDATGLVFPSWRGKTLSDMTLSKLLKEQRVKAVPTASGRVSGTGPRNGRTVRARSSRRPSPTS